MPDQQIVVDHLAANSNVSGITLVEDSAHHVVRSIPWQAVSDASGVVRLDAPTVSAGQTISERITGSRPIDPKSPLDWFSSMTHFEKVGIVVFVVIALLLVLELIVEYQYLKRRRIDQFEDMSLVRQGVTGIG